MTETVQVEPKMKVVETVVRTFPFEIIDPSDGRVSTAIRIEPGERQMFIARSHAAFRAEEVHMAGVPSDGSPTDDFPLRLVEVQVPSLDAPEGTTRRSIAINQDGPVVVLPKEVLATRAAEEIVLTIENRSDRAWSVSVVAKGIAVAIDDRPYAALLGFRPTADKTGIRRFVMPPLGTGTLRMMAPYLCRITRMRMRTDAAPDLFLVDVTMVRTHQLMGAAGINVGLFKDWFSIGDLDAVEVAQNIELSFHNDSSEERWIEIDLQVCAANEGEISTSEFSQRTNSILA